MDPVFVSCLLQPPTSHHDPNYVAIRRLLLHSKVQSLLQRKDFRGFNLSFGHRTSFSSNDADHHSQFFKPAYSFVGMHCIFDNCKASVTILKFRRMSSDLLAYGASDGSLAVCRVSEAPSVIQHLKGHSKAITVHCFIFCGQNRPSLGDF